MKPHIFKAHMLYCKMYFICDYYDYLCSTTARVLTINKHYHFHTFPRQNNKSIMYTMRHMHTHDIPLSISQHSTQRRQPPPSRLRSPLDGRRGLKRCPRDHSVGGSLAHRGRKIPEESRAAKDEADDAERGTSALHDALDEPGGELVAVTAHDGEHHCVAGEKRSGKQ